MTGVLARRLGLAVATAVFMTGVVAAPQSHAGDRDCSDFSSQKKAQKFFKKHNPKKDPHGLDSDNDGIACESNPCPCKPRLAADRATGPELAAHRTARMTEKDAKFYISRHLKDAYGKKWQFGHKKKFKDCKNLNPQRVRCSVSWYFEDDWYFHGSGTAWYPEANKGIVKTRISTEGDKI